MAILEELKNNSLIEVHEVEPSEEQAYIQAEKEKRKKIIKEYAAPEIESILLKEL